LSDILALGGLCVVAVWASKRVLGALAEPLPPTRHYLAGRHANLQMEDLIVYDDEVLLTFVNDRSIELTTHTWCAAREPSSQHRLERWREDRTSLHAYVSSDGAIMLADHRWGGNVACEPAVALT
jgi:hypothetical protein